MDNTLKKMKLSYLGTGKHKIAVKSFLEQRDAIFLDVRAKEEVETFQFNFQHFNIEVIHIPIDELPDRFKELPKNKVIGAFCSSGTRSAWAYIYLLSKGFEKVKWIEAGNEEIAGALKPGFIFKNL
ncbi:rhodanese-like domain-containing protein [Ancylomarina longa]|uniref:Rhodanese-like domain-containing protein n=1 Tax=Ancylomarina longa TaxID=2487017 RepID=A0A434AGU5_9BACT|nr:rhodanese-like domain-containing protein [Ancylomarina longa]RUT73614.1 rhodanese-like domain-containing protein [Ancylomarina longa]